MPESLELEADGSPEKFPADVEPEPGDLIEIFRVGYQHWAVYVGQGFVIHLAPSCELPNAGLDSLASVLSCKAQVRRERLGAVAGGHHYRVNNKHDGSLQPRPSLAVVGSAEGLVGCELAYRLGSCNCEHFVTRLRYGVARSDQVRPGTGVPCRPPSPPNAGVPPLHLPLVGVMGPSPPSPWTPGFIPLDAQTPSLPRLGCLGPTSPSSPQITNAWGQSPWDTWVQCPWDPCSPPLPCPYLGSFPTQGGRWQLWGWGAARTPGIFLHFIDFIDVRAGRDLGRSSSPAPRPKGRKSAGVIGSQQDKHPVSS
ncbi:uncharacterized protein LOC102558336 isoform X1 [Alligator mississippiensis]|uniref:uncharacterized protein LOC102558336 isoform X1 n=1 Tax=Alligator mississippiensis TaxID=8496 RepID=UPI002877F60C|nr:uncharacterized protein LOC102558336 isoform X1 [Alligator mississippiensis]